MNDGSLAVGTGDTGKLYGVRAAGAKAEASLLIDTNETHIISLAADKDGNLIAGTDPGGLMLRISPAGKAFALFDSPLREIHSLALASDGAIYALALSDAATGPRQSAQPAQSSQSVTTSSGGGTVTGTVTSIDESGAQAAVAFGAAQQTQVRSRNELQGARSAVFRIAPDGGTDVLWSSASATAFAVAAAPQGGSVLIGTSDKGRIYSVTDDGRDTLLVQSSEDQISIFPRARSRGLRRFVQSGQALPLRRGDPWPRAVTSRPCVMRVSSRTGGASGGAVAGRSNCKRGRATQSVPT